jgi:ABC-type uncharacterized transport system ATPase subunit
MRREPPFLRMQEISKYFSTSGVLANDRVDFQVAPREIHALVGENGAGKTTLMNILFGLEHPDAGRIFLRGEEVQVRSPQDAGRLGIGMVHQHFRLIGEFSIAENVVLGAEPTRNGLFFDREEARRRVQAVTESYGFHLDVNTRAERLSVGQMQLVEIIKMLYRRSELLILDEPTSVLTEHDIHKLFATLKQLVALGKTCIIITHKLGEVKSVAQRVTVMRRGRVVAVKDAAEVSERELSSLMVGESGHFRPRRFVDADNARPGRKVLELRGVGLQARGRERPLLEAIDLDVRAGEILGIAGISGNGLEEIEDLVSGLRRPTAGRILHDGEDITELTIRELRRKKLAYVPADRLQRGASLKSSVTENMIVAAQSRFARAGVIRRRTVLAFAHSLKERYSIQANLALPMGMLSGGNIQKVILARELAMPTDFILFSEPTWGLDVAASEFVYTRILELRARSIAVLLISSDLDEILTLADRLIVLYRGRIAARLTNSGSLDKEAIGEYMLGIRA